MPTGARPHSRQLRWLWIATAVAGVALAVVTFTAPRGLFSGDEGDPAGSGARRAGPQPVRSRAAVPGRAFDPGGRNDPCSAPFLVRTAGGTTESIRSRSSPRRRWGGARSPDPRADAAAAVRPRRALSGRARARGRDGTGRAVATGPRRTGRAVATGPRRDRSRGGHGAATGQVARWPRGRDGTGRAVATGFSAMGRRRRRRAHHRVVRCRRRRARRDPVRSRRRVADLAGLAA